jgi:hypothetical protein
MKFNMNLILLDTFINKITRIAMIYMLRTFKKVTTAGIAVYNFCIS